MPGPEASTAAGVFASVLQAASIAVGWYVVHRLSAARDLDKARREIVADSVDGLASELNQLLLDARAYHIAARNVETEIKIKMTLQGVNLQVQGLADLRCDVAAVGKIRASVRRLKQAITGGHFEDEHTEPLPANAQQLELIAAEVIAARQSMLFLKHRQFVTADQ